MCSNCSSSYVVFRAGKVELCKTCLLDRWPNAPVQLLERPQLEVDPAQLGQARPAHEHYAAANPVPVVAEARQPVPGFVMTAEMEQVFEDFGEENQFLTGKAGTGKTSVVQQILATTDKQAAIVAPTGVAALNAGGQTIHSFFRFSPALEPGHAVARGGLALPHPLHEGWLAHPRDFGLVRQLSEEVIVEEVGPLGVYESADFTRERWHVAHVVRNQR